MAATATKKKGKSAAPAPAGPEFPPLLRVDPETVYAGHDNMQLISTINIDEDHLRERESVDPAYIHGLAQAIAANGLKQAVGVTKDSRLVYGLCRIRACELLGLKTIPIVIDPSATEEEIHSSRAAENLQRQDLNPIEQASAVARLMDSLLPAAMERWSAGSYEGGVRLEEYIPEQAAVRKKQVELAARRLGKSESWVRDRDFLGRLSGKARRYVLEGQLPLAHAREISKVADPEKRDEIAEAARIGGGKYRPREFPISMRDLRGLVAEQMNSLASVPWKLELPVAGKGPCTICPHNSANNAGLFDHNAPQFGKHDSGSKEPAAGVCLLRSCYSAKSGAANRAVGTYAKRAVKEIVALPAKERPAITAKSISKHIPEFLRARLVVERAKEEMQRAPAAAASKGGKAKASAGESYKPPAKTVEQKAAQSLENAHRKWRGKVEDAIEPLVKTRPAALAALTFVDMLDLFDYAAPKKTRGVVGPERQRLLTLACEATPQALAEICAAYTCPRISLYSIAQWGGALELIVEKLGLKVPPAPKLEDFMPKEKPAAKTGAKGKAAAKTPGKKKAKKKAAKKKIGVALEDDTEEGPDGGPGYRIGGGDFDGEED